MTSPNRDIEVNVVSSPESTSRNTSPEPNDTYSRIVNHSSSITTCFPVIKTSEDEEKDGKASATQQKTSGGSTNFSISSILSRSEPTAKKNGFMSNASSGQGLLEGGFATGSDSAVLSRYFF